MAKTTTKPASTKAAAPAKADKKAPAPVKGSDKKGTTEKAGAKDKEKTKKAKAPKIEAGMILVFDGYGKPVEEPLFAEGDYIRVLEVNEAKEKFTAERINTEEGEDEAPADTVLFSEVHAPTDAEQAEIDSIVEQEEDEDSAYKKKGDDDEDEDADEDGEEESEEDEEDDDSEEEESDDEEESEDEEEESDDEDEEESEDEDEEEEAPKPKKKGTKDAAPAKSDKKDKSADKGKDSTKGKGKKADAEEEDEDAEEEEEAIALTPELQALVEESGDDILAAASAVKSRMNRDVVDMGVLLSQIKVGKVHATITHKVEDETTGKKKTVPKFTADGKGFESYVKTTLDLEPRVAYGYMAVAKLAATFGISNEQVASIGWTKLQQICDIANKGNIKELLKQAKSLSREALIQHVTENYTDKGEGSGKRKGSDDKTKKLSLKLSFFADQADLVKTTIATYKEENNIADDDKNGDAKALVFALQELASLKGGGEDDESEEDESEEEEAEAPKKSKKPAKKVTGKKTKGDDEGEEVYSGDDEEEEEDEDEKPSPKKPAKVDKKKKK